MQINRLIEIVTILLNQKQVTANDLAQRFSVSQRTIYRDIDALSGAGIPVYMNKGKGGGICLLPNYALNHNGLSDNEQMEILSALHSLKAVGGENVASVIHKLGVMFGKNNVDWIEIDFSRWGSGVEEKKIFSEMKTAILNKKVVELDYYSGSGDCSTRRIEPLKLIFKSYAWYLYAFCQLKDDFRYFRISRIKNCRLTETSFFRSMPQLDVADSLKTQENLTKIVIKIYSKAVFRMFDEFGQGVITENGDGSFTVAIELPYEEWLYSYLLSFGCDAEVLEPHSLREELSARLKKSIGYYQ